MSVSSNHVILDACCILNFCASGYFLEILASVPDICVVSEVVTRKELLTLQRMESEFLNGAMQFETAIKQGLLRVTDFQNEAEQTRFINYAFELGDDGESASFAIASHRDWSVATDDRKAISFAQRELPDITILSTPHILRHYWAEQTNPTELKKALYQIRSIGKYAPRKQDPLYDWWANILQY